MHATCPHCSQVIAVDDSKVPPGPFMLKCPRCQEVMKMPGKEAAPPPAPETPPVSKQPAPPSPPPAPVGQASAPSPQSALHSGPTEASNSQNGLPRAVVSLPDEGQANVITEVLQRQGYAVDSMEKWEERVIELQQGVYDLVVTHRNGLPSTPQNGLFHLVNGLAPEIRSRVFLVLVGDDYRTGDQTDAFAALADFVCRPQDMQAAGNLLRSTVAEKGRLYRAYLDIQHKKEAGEL